jgi:hypothetical protein
VKGYSAVDPCSGRIVIIMIQPHTCFSPLIDGAVDLRTRPTWIGLHVATPSQMNFGHVPAAISFLFISTAKVPDLRSAQAVSLASQGTPAYARAGSGHHGDRAGHRLGSAGRCPVAFRACWPR